MPYASEIKIVEKFQTIRPNLTFQLAEDQYSPFDLMALNEKGDEHALFELKSRSPEKCKYIRRDRTLLVDKQKVDSLSTLAKEKGIPAFIIQQLEDTGEISVLKVADAEGKVNENLVPKTINANQNTFFGGGKTTKPMMFYPLSSTVIIK